jgi:hypothetical protein
MVRYETTYDFRKTVRHSYIYWTTDGVRGIMAHENYGSGCFVYVLPIRAACHPPATYPYYRAETFCANLGHQIAELPTSDLCAAARRHQPRILRR